MWQRKGRKRGWVNGEGKGYSRGRQICRRREELGKVGNEERERGARGPTNPGWALSVSMENPDPLMATNDNVCEDGFLPVAYLFPARAAQASC